MEYTEYDGTDYASPPLDVYDNNWKRLILLSPTAFSEVGTERGIAIAPFVKDAILCGPLGSLGGRVLSIETVIGDEPLPKSNFIQERIETNFTLRSGAGGTPAEQIKRCSADNEILKRIIRKVLSGGYIDELTRGWPASGDQRYTPPVFQFISIQQFPIAEGKEKEYGYCGGVKLNLLATYQQIIPAI